MRLIGFTAGRYKDRQTLNNKINFLHRLGTTAIELHFGEVDNLFDYELDDDTIETLNKFEYISIHGPGHDMIYRNDERTREVISKLRLFSQKLNIKSIVLHPDLIKDYTLLKESGLPFVLENMDKRKNFAKNIDDLNELKKEGLGFVLDLQHAYEMDSDMGIANEMVELMGEGISHLHVSGQNKSSIHAPLFLADNKKEIIEFMLKLDFPIILEADLIVDFEENARKEFDFIKSYF